jgi:hypothetical protein
LGKPSIFSREYEKRMKRRRRNVIIISLTIVLVISALTIKVVCNPIDYTNIKNNIQAWIDSDTTSISEQTEKTKEETKNQEETIDNEPVKEEIEETLEESIDITLVSGNIAKAIYVNDNNGGKVFKILNTTDKDVSFNISPSGKQMIVTDTNSTITLYNVDGTTKVISKDQYISKSGGVFTKESTMQANPKYLWNANPKFISEEKIIFVSNRPYFGNAALKQYLWMTDIKTNEDKVFWESAGASIDIGEKEEKGMKITVDGNVYYMDLNGNYIR